VICLPSWKMVCSSLLAVSIKSVGKLTRGIKVQAKCDGLTQVRSSVSLLDCILTSNLQDIDNLERQKTECRFLAWLSSVQ
jgi:hypothetical protein